MCYICYKNNSLRFRGTVFALAVTKSYQELVIGAGIGSYQELVTIIHVSFIKINYTIKLYNS